MPPAPRPRPEVAPVATTIPTVEGAPIRREDAPAASPDVPADASYVPADAGPVRTDDGVERVSCASCGGTGHLGHAMGGPGGIGGSCSTCGGSGVCVPGRGTCYTPCFGDSFCGRFFSNLYECLCCPDPCYQPAWVPEANASFFTDPARPRTMTRFRWDRGWDMQTPDRAEFFWARQKVDPAKVPQVLRGGVFTNIKGGGKGPAFPGKKYVGPGRAPVFGETSLNYNRLYLYQEVATAAASFFIEQEYRELSPLLGDHSAGFADLNLGTKSLLVDCELLQLSFQFRTFIPTGAFNKGLGTGHVSLEPSLLLAVRLAPETYFQGQLAEWIPIGGDQVYQGSTLHYHFSFNQVLLRLAPDSPIIGTLEFNGYSFQDGAFTDPYVGIGQKASGETYFNMGPGLRTSICDRIDFGGAVAFPVSDGRWEDALLRMELRILY